MTEMLDVLIGSSVYDPSGEKIGKVKRVYVDNNSGEPTWVAVSPGLFSGEALVPLAGAQHRRDSATLQVQVRKDAVRTAPRLGHNGQISPEAEQELFDHYRIDAGPFLWDGRAGRLGQEARRPAGEPIRPPERAARPATEGMAQGNRPRIAEGEATEPTRRPTARIEPESALDPFAVDTADLGDQEDDPVLLDDPDPAEESRRTGIADGGRVISDAARRNRSDDVGPGQHRR